MARCKKSLLSQLADLAQLFSLRESTLFSSDIQFIRCAYLVNVGLHLHTYRRLELASLSRFYTHMQELGTRVKPYAMETMPQNSTSAYDHLLKILLIGDSNSNKRALLGTYIEDSENDEQGSTSTLGACVHMCVCVVMPV